MPADVGSSAGSLAVEVTDENGFVVAARPDGWSAVFGFYTPSLRTTELVPARSACCAACSSGASSSSTGSSSRPSTDGTYVPRATPKAIGQAEHGAVSWRAAVAVG